MSGTKKYILTANDLLEGDVVYLSNANNWVRELIKAHIFETKEGAENALKSAEKDINLVGAYIAEVDPDQSQATANHFREEFRATGPSNYFHGKQEQQNV